MRGRIKMGGQMAMEELSTKLPIGMRDTGSMATTMVKEKKCCLTEQYSKGSSSTINSKVDLY